MRNALVLGSNGAYGTRLASLLVDEGFGVVGVDARGEGGGRPWSTLIGDATAPDASIAAAIGAASHIIVCLPEGPAIAALGPLSAYAAAGALWVDLVSVKTRIVAALVAAPQPAEALSVHPLFAPEREFPGRDVVVVAVREGDRAREFIAMLGRWGARVTRLDAEGHDRHMAVVQAATHAVALSFAGAMGRLSHDALAGYSVGTGPHRLLLALLARILSRNADVYWEVQRANPFAPDARAALRDALDALDALCRADGPGGFRDYFAARVTAIGTALVPLDAYCTALFDVKPPALGPWPEPPRDAASAGRADSEFAALGRRIDEADDRVFRALADRLSLCGRGAEYRRRAGGAPRSAAEDLVRCEAVGARFGLEPTFVAEIYASVLEQASRLEDDLTGPSTRDE